MLDHHVHSQHPRIQSHHQVNEEPVQEEHDQVSLSAWLGGHLAESPWSPTSHLSPGDGVLLLLVHHAWDDAGAGEDGCHDNQTVRDLQQLCPFQCFDCAGQEQGNKATEFPNTVYWTKRTILETNSQADPSSQTYMDWRLSLSYNSHVEVLGVPPLPVHLDTGPRSGFGKVA